jgi:hypothetical protein
LKKFHWPLLVFICAEPALSFAAFLNRGGHQGTAMTIGNDLNNVKHWRDRAAEMRILSTMMEHVETQAIMVRLADNYDTMADRAEVRAGTSPLPK